jgi:hypothetical protein
VVARTRDAAGGRMCAMNTRRFLERPLVAPELLCDREPAIAVRSAGLSRSGGRADPGHASGGLKRGPPPGANPGRNSGPGNVQRSTLNVQRSTLRINGLHKEFLESPDYKPSSGSWIASYDSPGPGSGGSGWHSSGSTNRVVSRGRCGPNSTSPATRPCQPSSKTTSAAGWARRAGWLSATHRRTRSRWGATAGRAALSRPPCRFGRPGGPARLGFTEAAGVLLHSA